VADNQSIQSIQQRISAILDYSNGGSERSFAAPLTQQQVEEVEELEYMLARAEAELRVAQTRVDALRRELNNKRGPGDNQ